MSKDNVTRRVSIYVNGKEVENSLKGVEGAMAQVRNKMRLLNKDSENYDQDSKHLAQTMSDLKQKQADFREELNLTSKELKETGEASTGLRGALSGIWDSLASGDLKGAKEGLSSIKGEMGGLVKSTLAFITSPIGIAIGTLAGIAAGAKAMFDFNVNAEKGAQLIENLSGKTGQVVEDIRIKMQAMADTFEVGFESLAGAVDNLVDTGVAKDEFEALEKIKNGLLTAPDKNEFISSLESSAVTAKQVGLDLEEVIALKKSIEETGVNPEATFGALEKAGKNLALQTDKLRENLTSAFGAAFTDDILAKVKTGQITTVQALDLINTKSKEVGLNQTQQAEIGAQLFGKAAQSAGGYATILDTVSGGLKKQNEELNGNQKALSDLADANEKLQKAQSELFRVKDFGELWTKIKASAIDSLAGIITYVSDLKKDIQPLIDIIAITLSNSWHVVKSVVITTFAIIGGVVKLFFDNIKYGIEFVKKVFSGDFKGAFQILENAFKNLGVTVNNIFAKINNTIIDALKSIVSNASPILDALGFDVDKIQKKLDGFKSKEIDLSVNGKSNSSEANQEKEITKATAEELAKQQAIRDEARRKEAEKRKADADKKKQEAEKTAQEEKNRLLELAKAKAEVAKAELALFIATNRSKIESGQRLTQDLINQEAERLLEIEQKQLDAALVDRQKKLDADKKQFEEGKINAETLNLLKYEADLEYETLRTNLSVQTDQQIAANKKAFEEQEKQLRLEQAVLDNELALAEAATKDEASRIKQEQDYKAELARYKNLYDNKKITEEEYKRWLAVAKAKQDELDRVRDLQKLQQGLGAMNQLAGALGELFGQSKELAIAQALINGALAVTNIFATTPKADFGITTYALIAASAISTIASVAKISSTKAPAKPKFFYGGSTGTNPALGYDEFGAVTGYVHKNEYVIPEVMTQDPQFANTITWLEANRQQKLRGYVDGGGTSSGSIPSFTPTQTQDSNLMLANAVNRLNANIESGIMANVFFGYEHIQKLEDMKTEINQSTQNGIAG